MKAQCLSLDIISSLPSNIIETILCLLPIKDAARTSILSRNWRYKWVTIPKLEFIEEDFEVTAVEDRPSVKMQTFVVRIRSQRMTTVHRICYAIYQMLLVHRGPIHEFALSMNVDDKCVEIDQIILYLSRNHTLKKFKLDMIDRSYKDKLYRVPLSFFSLHQLTDLYLCNCHLHHDATKFDGFGSLTSLHMDHVNITTKTLLHLISGSPLLKSFSLITYNGNFLDIDGSTICELFERLPVIEHLMFSQCIIECFAYPAVPPVLPASLIHLKSFSLQNMSFCGKYGLSFLLFMIRCSPNLEKIKLQIDQYGDGINFEMDSIDYSDIYLEHLKEVEIEDMDNFTAELEFVKVILAKSPVLKKVSIVLCYKVGEHEELMMLRNLLRFPRSSPVVDIIIDHPCGSDRRF